MLTSVTLRFALQPDTELIEDVCDNERGMTHAVGRISGEVRANIDLTPEILSEYQGPMGEQVPGGNSPRGNPIGRVR